MDAYYVNKMAAKTEGELLEYFYNHEKYVPAAVLAAVNELQKRGRTFTDTELATLEPERQAVRKAVLEEIAQNAGSEEEAEELPQLYSPTAILGFSIIFNFLFGALLLATNLRQIGNRRGSWVVIGFSLFFMFLAVTLYQAKHSLSLWAALNMAGAFILNYYFWPKYVGVQRAYEAKPIWRALIISILIVLPLIVLLALFPPQK
ncbi:hypothetical protein AHMF7605_17965 [Adhaeribacter arboris]|uniref:Uncharacterized protein n=1 Tax=Adhaeribacter arboris TaxID=2072846 RepID=A0A2T2YIB1_9BACT|nr:hypothetical protein [Adhaeribacter arboris]PSR55256.1 hypothetical protein AHMF7605_17965 [Adhaeribacter arboris]